MNPNSNLIPNPQMDHQMPIPTPPTALQGFDPIESRFDELMNYHANLAPNMPLPPPNSVPFPILPYLPSCPFPCNPQNIPQNQHQIMKQDDNFVFGFDSPNPLHLNSNQETAQPYNNQDSSMIDPTLNETTKGTEKIAVPSSSATQEPLLEEIAGLSYNMPAPPSPMSYIESLIASLASPSPTSLVSADSSSASSPPPPSSSFSPLPCNSNPFLEDPSFSSIWDHQP